MSHSFQYFLDIVQITWSILVGSMVFGLLALLAAVLASFHKKHVLVTAVVATENTAGKVNIIAI